MTRASKEMMKIALLLMLFQFLAPAFLPIALQGTSKLDKLVYHVQHNSIVAPLLLKEKEEKDEKEHEEFFSISGLAPLLDLTAHSSNLTASHKGKGTYFSNEHRYDSGPSLFTINCSFLI